MCYGAKLVAPIPARGQARAPRSLASSSGDHAVSSDRRIAIAAIVRVVQSHIVSPKTRPLNFKERV